MVAGDAIVLSSPIAVQEVEQNRILVDLRVSERLLPGDVKRIAIDHLQAPLEDKAVIAACPQIPHRPPDRRAFALSPGKEEMPP